MVAILKSAQKGGGSPTYMALTSRLLISGVHWTKWYHSSRILGGGGGGGCTVTPLGPWTIISFIPLFWFFISNVGVVWGGGGVTVFLAFYTISNIHRKNNSGNKKIYIYFFRKKQFFFGNIRSFISLPATSMCPFSPRGISWYSGIIKLKPLIPETRLSCNMFPCQQTQTLVNEV